MITEALKEEVSKLPPVDRRQLMGYLVGLQIRVDSDYSRVLTDRIDDQEPDNWMTLEQLDAKLKTLPDA